MRLRCWAVGEARPSKYSEEVVLPRWNGTINRQDAERKPVVEFRSKYFAGLTQHVTVGKPVLHRIGNAASPNRWGGDPDAPPPLPTEKERLKGLIMAPVPYDTPQLVPAREIEEAGDELARFYREMGVHAGGGGVLFGLRIDHVIHAIVGTPTTDGHSSPSRTVAGLTEPLMALCEVVYNDVLLPLIDDVAVLRSEWQFVDEKVSGIIAQIVEHRARYTTCEKHLKEILSVLLEVYEMVRHCRNEQALHFHLTHQDYTRDTRRALKGELTERICDTVWKLSTELLEMQLDSRCPELEAPVARGSLSHEVTSKPAPHDMEPPVYVAAGESQTRWKRKLDLGAAIRPMRLVKGLAETKAVAEARGNTAVTAFRAHKAGQHLRDKARASANVRVLAEAEAEAILEAEAKAVAEAEAKAIADVEAKAAAAAKKVAEETAKAEAKAAKEAAAAEAAAAAKAAAAAAKAAAADAEAAALAASEASAKAAAEAAAAFKAEVEAAEAAEAEAQLAKREAEIEAEAQAAQKAAAKSPYLRQTTYRMAVLRNCGKPDGKVASTPMGPTAEMVGQLEQRGARIREYLFYLEAELDVEEEKLKLDDALAIVRLLSTPKWRPSPRAPPAAHRAAHRPAPPPPRPPPPCEEPQAEPRPVRTAPSLPPSARRPPALPSSARVAPTRPLAARPAPALPFSARAAPALPPSALYGPSPAVPTQQRSVPPASRQGTSRPVHRAPPGSSQQGKAQAELLSAWAPASTGMEVRRRSAQLSKPAQRVQQCDAPGAQPCAGHTCQPPVSSPATARNRRPHFNAGMTRGAWRGAAMSAAHSARASRLTWQRVGAFAGMAPNAHGGDA